MTPRAVFAAYPDMRMCPIDDSDERGTRSNPLSRPTKSARVDKTFPKLGERDDADRRCRRVPRGQCRTLRINVHIATD
jgi:hypothetical protein